MLGAQAPGAQAEPFLLTVHNESDSVNIRHPAPLGMALGVTNIIAELWRLVTQIALQEYISLTICQLYSILWYGIILAQRDSYNKYTGKAHMVCMVRSPLCIDKVDTTSSLEG